MDNNGVQIECSNSSEDYEQIEKLIPDQIPQLRKILQDKLHIMVPTKCDELFARCIRMEKGDLENALKLVKAYHTATGDFPNWDATFLPSPFVDLYNQQHLLVTSQRDREGRRVFICRAGKWDPDIMTSDQSVACIWMILQYITAVCKDTQRRGIIAIWDFAGVSLKHLWATNKRNIPNIIKLIQSHTVGTINEFHAINHPQIFRIFFESFIKPFLKESPQKWIFFHDDVASLHSHIDKNGLPKFLGGDQEINECMDLKLMKAFFRQDQYYTDMLKDRFPRY